MEDSIRRANAYKLYHEDPAFREPWEQVRAAFVARWQTTTPAEADVRETIYRYLGLMTKLDQFVAEVIRDGALDEAKFEAMVKLNERRNDPD